MDKQPELADVRPEPEAARAADEKVLLCDRCGCKLIAANCKLMCLNCGNRFDCSDLTLYFD